MYVIPDIEENRGKDFQYSFPVFSLPADVNKADLAYRNAIKDIAMQVIESNTEPFGSMSVLELNPLKHRLISALNVGNFALVDDNNQAYLYYNGNRYEKGSKPTSQAEALPISAPPAAAPVAAPAAAPVPTPVSTSAATEEPTTLEEMLQARTNLLSEMLNKQGQLRQLDQKMASQIEVKKEELRRNLTELEQLQSQLLYKDGVTPSQPILAVNNLKPLLGSLSREPQVDAEGASSNEASVD